MKVWQNIVCSCCAIGALVVGVAAPNAFAAETTANSEKEPLLISAPAVASWQRAVGTIAEITAVNDGHRLLVNVSGDSQKEIIFLVPEGTPIIDNETALPLSVADLKVGEEIYLTYGPAMTKSLPPQTLAHGIVARVGEGKSPATFIQVGEVKKADEQIQVASADGNYLLWLTAETPIKPLLTKNIITVDQIKPGCTLFAWFDIMTLSLPAQATPDKVVLASCPVTEEITAFSPAAITVKDKININGKAYPLPLSLVTTETTCQVPVRVIGEALGFTVDWQEATAQVTLTKGDKVVTFSIGNNHYQEQGGVVKQLSQAPVLQGEHTIAPVELWQWLAEGELSVANGTLQLQTK